jgi:hypothetical protein
MSTNVSHVFVEKCGNKLSNIKIAQNDQAHDTAVD